MKNTKKIPRLHAKLLDHRVAHSLTQGQLAKELGVSRQTINAIEAGKKQPSLEFAFKLAKYFERTMEDFFYYR